MPFSSALVLAAGLGTRLDPLTRIVAKAAVPLAGRTLLERILDQLRGAGIVRVVVNLHHRPETITGVIGDGAHLGLEVRYSWEGPRPLGSAGGPRHALELMGPDPLLIVNGDTLADVSLQELASRHRPGGVTMALVPNSSPDQYGGVLLDEQDRVTGFVPRGPAAQGSWHFVGVQAAAAEVFAALPEDEPSESTSGQYRDLIAREPGRIRGWRTTGRVIDVGTPRDYLAAVLTLVGDGTVSLEPGAVVDGSATLDRTVVWPGATVGPESELTGCIVGGDVAVPAGFRATDAILLPPAIVRSGDTARVQGGVAVFALS